MGVQTWSCSPGADGSVTSIPKEEGVSTQLKHLQLSSRVCRYFKCKANVEYLRIKELFKGASRGTDRHGCRAACASKAGMETKSTERKCEDQETRSGRLEGTWTPGQREGSFEGSFPWVSWLHTPFSWGQDASPSSLSLSLLTGTAVLMDPVSV